MNYKQVNRIFAAVVFLISLIVLASTVQPTVSFWDCGEFIAAAFSLQVPHPPGSPFFTILGRVFAMLPIADSVALRVNIISVLTSSFSILFLYLIAVKLIQNYRGKEPKNAVDAMGTYISAAIGALAFSFSDTFWFSGVEAEVYAASICLFSAITYLMIIWNEKADNKDNEKYILILAYLIGISTGVHLMSVLAIVSVVMMIMFRKYVQDEGQLKTSSFILLGHIAIVLIIAFVMWGGQTGKNIPSPEQYQGFDFKFKMIVAAVSGLIMAAFWKKIFNRNSIYLPLMIGGAFLFLTYPGIVKILPGIIADISGDHSLTAIIVFGFILAVLGYAVQYSVKKQKPTMHVVFMSIIFILLGFTTYTMIIIRSNQNPPMNENEPNDFSELVSYLNREQYGDFPIFKRRFASEPHQQGVYQNYDSDLDFWWRYQMNHMTTRYLLWNFAGREGWEQDDGPNIAPFNGIGNAIGKIFSIHFAGDAANSLYGIPFLLGLIGIYFHFRKDWKMATIFMVLFIFMGYLTAFYQNQQQPQPRERDYFYVGAFFVYGIWIAIGMRGLFDLLSEKIKASSVRNASVFGLLALGVLFVPVNMLKTNYYTHDRSENWIPWDYSYNILQSCEPNAVLFTNGDNDTFPLWYLQDVEGVRRDVKIVCLSLANTPWYIMQLKHNDPYNVGTINIRFSDEQINSPIRPVQWDATNVTIPVPKGLNTSGMDIQDSTVLKNGSFTFKLNPTVNFGNIKAIRVQDILVKEIVEANNWQRPLYFSATCANDAKIGLSNYLKLEGMAERLVPEKQQNPNTSMLNIPALNEELMTNNPGYSKDFKRGFKFRGLNNPDMFVEDDIARMLMNYRQSYLKFAYYYIDRGRDDKGLAIMDTMMNRMPRSTVGMEYDVYAQIANVYSNVGAMDKYKAVADQVEREARAVLEKDPTDLTAYRVLINIYENLKDYRKMYNLWLDIEKVYPQDPGVKSNVQKFKELAEKQDSLNNK